MAENSLITEGLKKLRGMTLEPIIFKVEEGAIKRYAEAIADPNPLYNDEEYARKSSYGKLICPPGFAGWPTRGKMPYFRIVDALRAAGAPARILDGSTDYEFFEPIVAGDVLTATVTITDIHEKESRSGRIMMYTLSETTYAKENGDIALKQWATFISY